MRGLCSAALLGASLIARVSCTSTTITNLEANPSFIGLYLTGTSTQTLFAGTAWVTSGKFAGDCSTTDIASCTFATACSGNVLLNDAGQSQTCDSPFYCATMSIFASSAAASPIAMNYLCREAWSANTVYRQLDVATTEASSSTISTATTTTASASASTTSNPANTAASAAATIPTSQSTPTSSSSSSSSSTSSCSSSSSQSSSSASNAHNTKSKSKAWIAGAAIGAIAIVGLIAGLIWLRRRRRTRKQQKAMNLQQQPDNNYQYQYQYHRPGDDTSYNYGQQGHGHGMQAAEMQGSGYNSQWATKGSSAAVHVQQQQQPAELYSQSNVAELPSHSVTKHG